MHGPQWSELGARRKPLLKHMKASPSAIPSVYRSCSRTSTSPGTRAAPGKSHHVPGTSLIFSLTRTCETGTGLLCSQRGKPGQGAAKGFAPSWACKPRPTFPDRAWAGSHLPPGTTDKGLNPGGLHALPGTTVSGGPPGAELVPPGFGISHFTRVHTRAPQTHSPRTHWAAPPFNSRCRSLTSWLETAHLHTVYRDGRRRFAKRERHADPATNIC